jgi:hypothetical protein
MKRLLMAFGVAGIVAATAVGGASAHGTPSDNANAVGIERAARNSNGGDRAHGVFGQEQSTIVARINAGETLEDGYTYDNYGQFLQDWKAAQN